MKLAIYLFQKEYREISNACSFFDIVYHVYPTLVICNNIMVAIFVVHDIESISTDYFHGNANLT